MMAPVQPKPTKTASTGFRVVATALSLRPTGAALESDRGKGHPLAVTSDPILVVIVGPRETNHFPRAHSLVAAVYRIGEIAFLGVFHKHGKQRFGLDSAVKLDVAALHFLQPLVLVGGVRLRKNHHH